MFTLKLVVSQEAVPPIDYRSVEQLKQDIGLLALFADGLVSKCEVHDADGKRIVGLPFMEWDRLVEEVGHKFGDHMVGGRR